jgi:hypothetical protein
MTPQNHVLNLFGTGALDVGDIVVVSLNNTDYGASGFRRTATTGVVKAIEERKASVEVDGFGLLDAYRPTYSRNLASSLGKEMFVRAVNRLGTDDVDVIGEYYTSTGLSSGTKAVLVHVTDMGQDGRAIADFVGEYHDFTGRNVEDHALEADGYDLEVETVGVTEFMGPFTIDVSPVRGSRIGRDGVTPTPPASQAGFVKGDLLLASEFSITVDPVAGHRSATLSNPLRLGSYATRDDVAAFLNYRLVPEPGVFKLHDTVGSPEVYHELELGYARNEADEALVFIPETENSWNTPHVLGATGYHAAINDDVSSGLSDRNEPGLWLVENLHNWASEDDGGLRGDWRPATVADVERLFGAFEDCDAELDELADDTEFVRQGATLRAIAMAEEQVASALFQRQQRPFLAHKFGLRDAEYWHARTIANRDKIAAFVGSIVSKVRDERFHTYLRDVITADIATRSSLFRRLEAPDQQELAIEAVAAAVAKKSPVYLFVSSDELQRYWADMVEFVARFNEEHSEFDSLLGNDRGRSALMQSPYRLASLCAVPPRDLRSWAVFSKAREMDGEWRIEPASRGGDPKFHLAVGGRHVATLLSTNGYLGLVRPNGMRYTSTEFIMPGRDLPAFSMDALQRDADRAVAQFRSRLLLGDLSSDPEDGEHSTADYPTIRIRDGVLHAIDEPAVVSADGAVSYFQRGHEHREDGPAIIEDADNLVWLRFGVEHRHDGPSREMSDGTRHYKQFGRFHRDDGPAVIVPALNPIEGWYDHGLRHRDDGPASIDGAAQLHYRLGSLHRTDGPACVSGHGEHDLHYVDGGYLTEEQFRSLYGDDTRSEPVATLTA